jgi:asparagine synthase (glutamine-hydrolysing)
MCGIAGYAGVDEPAILQRMADAMSYRGPDDSGVWWDSSERAGLAHRRLSVIDLSSAGHQPMTIDDGDFCISYNGEIYNFQDHRRRLEARGIAFRSRTDTEVVLRLYQERGLDALQVLNGMFAFALWDRAKRRMLLARDHAGIKPLYYATQGQAIYFASEIKALLTVPAIPNSLNERALESYLTFLWVPGEETLMRGIRKLEPGHYLLWEQGQIAIKPWFALSYEPEHGRTAAEWVDEVRAAVLSATRRQVVADVPLGAFLSGGLDSSSLVASMRASFPDRRIRTYTTRSQPGDVAAEQGTDDYPFARRAAQTLGVELKTVDVEPDVTQLLPRLVYHLDEPDADPAVFPTYLISKLAREDGTRVLLSGTGGDEVFFGYRSHQAFKLANQLGMLAPALGALSRSAAAVAAPILGRQHRITRRLGKLARGLLAPNRLARHLAIVDWSSPLERRALLGAIDEAGSVERAGFDHYDRLFRGHGDLNFHSHLLTNTFLAAHNFLYMDKSSMAASLEVRVPFMDLELMRLAARIPEELKLHGTTTKYVLKTAMASFLPRDIIYRAKTGFGAPLRRWIRKDLRPLVQATLGADTVRRRGLFEPQAVARLLVDNDAGRADHAYLIYALLTLEIWMQTFVDQRAKCIAT